ncbi:hypothetical protein M0F01_21000, partial [Ralstonia solanacearum]|nr:hypothetical protein [Ralstonia solanacearum]
MISDGRNPGSNADNHIPVLTEIVELDDAAPAEAPPVQAPSQPAAGAAVVPPALREQGLAPVSYKKNNQPTKKTLFIYPWSAFNKKTGGGGGGGGGGG